MSILVADALTTVAEVETFLGLSSGADTARITNAINHATKRILNYIDRTIASTARTEYYDGTDTPILVLRHYPIIGNPTTVNVDGNRDFAAADDLTVDDDYLVEADEGILRLVGQAGAGIPGDETVWPRGYQNIKVVYTAGYASTPEGLLQVATEFAAYYYDKRGTRGNTRYSLGSVMVDEDINHPSGIPSAFRGDLDAYVRPDLDDQFDSLDVPALL